MAKKPDISKLYTFGKKGKKADEAPKTPAKTKG